MGLDAAGSGGRGLLCLDASRSEDVAYLLKSTTGIDRPRGQEGWIQFRQPNREDATGVRATKLPSPGGE
jgi:hypothetical protein